MFLQCAVIYIVLISEESGRVVSKGFTAENMSSCEILEVILPCVRSSMTARFPTGRPITSAGQQEKSEALSFRDLLNIDRVPTSL